MSLNDAVKDILAAADKGTSHRRAVQATLMDTHGENADAIDAMRMKMLAQGEVKTSLGVTLSGDDMSTVPFGRNKPTGRGR